MADWTLEKALSLALSMEKESIGLYTSAQERVINPGSRQFLKELVVEEERHRDNILQAMEDPSKIGEIGALDTKIQDLKIVDDLEPTSLSAEADYQEILIYAAKREKATHDFYMKFAKKYRESQIGRMFANLAKEELKHKYRLEIEYDDVILWQM
ncbi:MAG: ferritin family protein [Candidatus Bathyarchaeota archaeon]|nr:MAG: ferritin family protein [Candidatus Bathyarchaeota archaeon]